MPNPRIEPLKKVLAIDPNDEVAWFGFGKAYMEDANFEEAAKALRQCITVKPAYSAAYYALAQSLKTWTASTNAGSSVPRGSTSPPRTAMPW